MAWESRSTKESNRVGILSYPSSLKREVEPISQTLLFLCEDFKAMVKSSTLVLNGTKFVLHIDITVIVL
jgi:hypothetical protein